MKYVNSASDSTNRDSGRNHCSIFNFPKSLLHLMRFLLKLLNYGYSSCTLATDVTWPTLTYGYDQSLLSTPEGTIDFSNCIYLLLVEYQTSRIYHSIQRNTINVRRSRQSFLNFFHS